MGNSVLAKQGSYWRSKQQSFMLLYPSEVTHRSRMVWQSQVLCSLPAELQLCVISSGEQRRAPAWDVKYW